MDPPRKKTLMEKWKDHYDTKDEAFKMKPERANIAGVVFFWTFTVSLMYTALNILIPQLTRYKATRRYWFTAFAWFVAFEVTLNWFLSARKTPSQVKPNTVPQGGQGQSLVPSLPEGWKSCPTCQLDTPPRSHHCKICKMCVLKRDHHCFFTGSCVGFFNQRYFIVFVFYSTLALSFATYLLTTYLAAPKPFLSRHCISYFFPAALVQWLLGYLSFAHLALLGQLNASLLCLLGSVWFLGWELLVVARGQTSFEAMRGLHRYRMPVGHNFRGVFGPLWILNFILPMPFTQIGNGVDWGTQGAGKTH